MDLKFDDNEGKRIIASTLMTVLTPERKDELLREAIVHVLEEKDKQSYDGHTRLQNIFIQVVHDYAKERIGELLKNDPGLQAQLDKLTRELLAESMTAVKDKLADTVIGTMTNALKGRW